MRSEILPNVACNGLVIPVSNIFTSVVSHTHLFAASPHPAHLVPPSALHAGGHDITGEYESWRLGGFFLKAHFISMLTFV